MKNGVKSIGDLRIPIIILALLIIGLIAAYYFSTAEKSGSDPTETSQIIDVLSLSVDDVLFVSVEGIDDTNYRISRETNATAEKRWSFEGLADQYSEDCFSQELLENFILEASYIASFKTIEANDAGLSEFGLADPTAEVTYGLASGENVHLQIGSKTVDGKSAYLRMGSEGLIYIVPVEKADVFSSSAMNFFDRRVLDYSSRNIATFRFSRRSDDLDVMARPEALVDSLGNSSRWRLTEPIDFQSGVIFDHLAASLLALEIDEYVTDSIIQIEEYGLDSPEYTFTVIESDGSITSAYFSREMSGKYYGYTDRIPGVFRISSDRISGLDVSLIEYYFPFPVQAMIEEVKSIKAVFPDGEFLAEIDISDGMMIRDQEASVLVNRRSAKVTDSNGNAYFLLLFASVMEIRFAEVSEEIMSADDATISIQIVKKDNQITSIELSPAHDDLYALFLNGHYTGFLVSSDEIYSDNIAQPGVWYAYELLNQALDGQINGKYDVPVS
ncbi:MAG: DUF4340 domain-containing protein [Oscillospiraceae bacterium]|jgi:hypothetical protein|nr:DUF4340 domain-containing protein [Oscillospiraceae bacterium]